jgi:hypothetical protein
MVTAYDRAVSTSRSRQIQEDPASAAAKSAENIEDRWQDWLPAVAPKTYSAGFEWFHADFWGWYWPILQLRRRGLPVPEDVPLDCFLPWGRGLAKSSSMEGLALAEGAMIGEAFGVYISSTQDKAREHLQAIRDLIEGSEIAKYYPKLANPRLGKFGNQRGWKSDAIYTDGGFGLVSCSLEQGIRGLKDGNRRPSFIILDDIDERDDSLDTKAEKFESLTQDALPMLAPYGLTVFGQNLIYNGSIAHDTLTSKADWFKHCHIVGTKDGANWKPVNTYQDDLEIEKRGNRPTIVAGTPNWKRLDRQVSQRLLDKIGERSFWRECQNQTAPDPEELVWKTFSPQHSIITWEEFAAVFGTSRIRSDFNLVAGYDRGNTGPSKHPGVFTVAAVAPERHRLSGDVFIFYEYIAEATEDVGDMARHLIEDLAILCDHPDIKKAAKLVKDSFRGDVAESHAWDMRQSAGEMIPFEVFNGSHEALGERNTLQRNWGLTVAAGKSGKTEGLEQLHHYAKLEDVAHPFRPSMTGKPNLWFVVASDQYEVAVDRFGLQRLRWEAENLKWDKNITTRDVPTKMGDDATDTVKHYMQTFRLTGQEKTQSEEREDRLPESLRLTALQESLPSLRPEEEWRHTAPRKLALAEMDRTEREAEERADPLSIFDRCL